MISEDKLEKETTQLANEMGIQRFAENGSLPAYCYNSKVFAPGKTPVYYSGPYWDEKESIAAVKTFLNGKWLSTGTEVYKFQNQFSKLFGVRYSHMVNSGSSANLVMIAALKKYYGWKDGDEVIVSPVGFPTTIAPLVQNGLKPVFVDIEMNTLNFDLSQVEEAITTRTVAIFVSPVLGNPPDMDHLREIAGTMIHLIGDNCDSLGSKWNGEYFTNLYTAWSTSFYPAHHITTGEGGMISSNNEEIIKIARSISWWGRACYCVGQANLLSCGTCGKRFDKWLDDVDTVVDHKYVFENMGYNLKPLDLQGAIGQEQLKKFPEVESKRRENFKVISSIIHQRLSLWDITVARFWDKADPSWFGVPIICRTPEIKQSLVDHLEKNKIQTRNYFAGNILLHPGYKHLGDSSKYPNANKALTHVFFLGCPPHYTKTVLDYISEVISSWKA
jgi:CDP-6-deoxy-D-xylo-4-hexulose-3-dehydrase